MSKRKGLSADEKRNRMLEIFYEKKEFFQLKVVNITHVIIFYFYNLNDKIFLILSGWSGVGKDSPKRKGYYHTICERCSEGPS